MTGGRQLPIFYRILRSESAAVADFLSYAELGIELMHDTAEGRRNAQGLTMHDDLEAARQRARPERGRRIGDFVAAAELDDGGPLTWRQTTRDPHHYTIEGNLPDRPLYLLARVRDVVPV